MAQAFLPSRKSDLSALFFRRSDTRNDIRLTTNQGEYYHLDLNFNHFGSLLSFQDTVLEDIKNLDADTDSRANQDQFTGWLIHVRDFGATDPDVDQEDATSITIDILPSQSVPRIQDMETLSRYDTSISTDSDWASLASVNITSEDATSLPIESKRMCIICLEELSVNRFPTERVTQWCRHDPNSCFSCLEYSIASDHVSKMWDNISCPECYSRLSFQDVQRLATAQTFSHYDSLSNRQTLSSLPNFFWCLGCEAGQFHEDGKSCPRVVCESCNAAACFTHNVPWHEGLSCEQYNKLLSGPRFSIPRFILPYKQSEPQKSSRLSSSPHPKITRFVQMPAILLSRFLGTDWNTNHVNVESVAVGTKPTTPLDKGQTRILEIQLQQREQKASIRRIKQVCKRCPGPSCNWPIQKVDGCKHMTCLKCSYEFCWRCKRGWGYGHKCWKL